MAPGTVPAMGAVSWGLGAGGELCRCSQPSWPTGPPSNLRAVLEKTDVHRQYISWAISCYNCQQLSLPLRMAGPWGDSPDLAVKAWCLAAGGCWLQAWGRLAEDAIFNLPLLLFLCSSSPPTKGTILSAFGIVQLILGTSFCSEVKFWAYSVWFLWFHQTALWLFLQDCYGFSGNHLSVFVFL